MKVCGLLWLFGLAQLASAQHHSTSDTTLSMEATGVGAVLDSVAALLGAIMSAVLQPVVAALAVIADTFVELVWPVLVQIVTTLYRSPPGRLVRAVFWEVLGLVGDLLQLVSDLIDLTLGVVGDVLELLRPVMQLVGRLVLEPVFKNVVWPLVELVVELVELVVDLVELVGRTVLEPVFDHVVWPVVEAVYHLTADVLLPIAYIVAASPLIMLDQVSSPAANTFCLEYFPVLFVFRLWQSWAVWGCRDLFSKPLNTWSS
jgi:hypothetical protein